MKKTFFNFSISLFSSIILGIVCSLVLAILKNNNFILCNILFKFSYVKYIIIDKIRRIFLNEIKEINNFLFMFYFITISL